VINLLDEWSTDAVKLLARALLRRAPSAAAVFLHPWGVLVVFYLDVGGEPVAQEVEQMYAQHDLAALKTGRIVLHLACQLDVFSAVRKESRIVCSGHHRLFGFEVVARISNKIPQ